MMLLFVVLVLQYDPKGGFRITAAYAQAGGFIALAWTPPTEYTDGAPLLEQDIDFYTLYCDGAEFITIDAIIGTHSESVNVTAMAPGDHACYLTVTMLTGAESDGSNTVNFTIGPRVPMAPAGLKLL